MWSLEKIENKLDKESGSNKSRSHETPDEETRLRSGSIHHHHSQKNSHKRVNNISIPTPIRKYEGMGWMS
jgi:hypothetical protein